MGEISPCRPHLQSLSSYQFSLPNELIAQFPSEERGQSRLLLVERKTGTIQDLPFLALREMLDKGDLLIMNDTKVIPARLLGQRKTGGKVEIFLVKKINAQQWDVLMKPAKKCRIGETFTWGTDFSATIIDDLGEGMKRMAFHYAGEWMPCLEKYGEIPLPKYIRRRPSSNIDANRYQTVYAKEEGAVAAPTAGLHFTQQMLNELDEKGVQRTTLTLHVGLGTFRPVTVEDITQHTMHKESMTIAEEAAATINQSRKGKKICVGTTTCRALETAATPNGYVVAGNYETEKFIYPGYTFQSVETLLTNFHLPGSTLLMLVSAFGGYELIQEAYAKAVEKKFRFFSYGDAMLIV